MKFISIIVFILILGGCSQSSPFSSIKPENIIPESKFKSILSEMVISEMMVQSKLTSPSQVNREINRIGKEILKKEGIDSIQYVRSFDYYASDKVKMEEIYNQIISNIDQKIKRLN